MCQCSCIVTVVTAYLVSTSLICTLMNMKMFPLSPWHGWGKVLLSIPYLPTPTRMYHTWKRSSEAPLWASPVSLMLKIVPEGGPWSDFTAAFPDLACVNWSGFMKRIQEHPSLDMQGDQMPYQRGTEGCIWALFSEGCHWQESFYMHSPWWLLDENFPAVAQN